MNKWFLKGTSLLVLMAVMLVVTACGSSSGKSAQGVEGAEADFPTKDIELVVPFAAGGTTDISARAVAAAVKEHLPNNVNINVVNREGGGGVIGMTDIFNGKPDGYKIGMATIGPMTLQPHTSSTVYEAESFEPIAQVIGTPNIMIVRKDAPWQTYEEWLAYVEENPEEFSYGMAGAGLTQHISMEAFSLETGVKLTPIPFDGGAPAIAAMLGGHISGALVQSTEATPHVLSGEARALFNVGSYKTEGLEDVPLVNEKGVDFSQDVWAGLIAPPGTPSETIAILQDAFKKALEDEKVIDQFKKIGVPPSYLSAEDFKKEILSTNEKNITILKKINLID